MAALATAALLLLFAIPGSAAVPQEDAGAGAAGPNASPTGVQYFPSRDVAARFAKAQSLYAGDRFKVHASRRVAPGVAEIHVRDTDGFYVLEGTARFVTGGTVPDRKNLSRDEIRGSRIVGGEARTLAKGDVIIVPNGTPHWFEKVDGPVLYLVVKITAP